MRATEIARHLAQSVERVCLHLLPDGKRKGHEWVCGDVDGSRGDSLKVRLTGDKAGVWADFATGEDGDLIGLWMTVRGQSLPDACRDAMQWLGISEAKVENPRKTFSKPSRENVQPLPPAGREWLRGVRKISDAAIDAYKLAFRKGALMFPYLRDGELIAAKYRAIPEKKFWTDADCEPCLFGWQAMPAGARAVILVEGEIDALTMWDYGFPALSVPFGGGDKDKQQWIDYEYDRLACYDEIILAMDGDEAGQKAVAEIVKRLGRERVRVAELPRKDANQCAVDGIAKEVIAKCISSAKSLDPENLRNAADYADAVWAEFSRGEDPGIRLPFGDDRVILRPGETSLWAGMNGHGKSQVIGFVAQHAMPEQGIRVCIASLEFIPPKLLRRLQIQHYGKRFLDEHESRDLSEAWRDHLWIFDPGTKNKADTLFETMRYAVKRYGIDLFVIDNLAKLGIMEDDYSGQQALCDRLSDFARVNQTHAALVHHVRKTDKGENAPPEKGDIKGSGGITDLVDTVFTVWRNKPKERRIRERTATPQDEMLPDAIVQCHKQRNGDHEPAYALMFDPMTYRYTRANNS